jgi:hypothetical protein
MASPLNRRQIALFVISIVLPSSVFIVLSLLVMSQQKELAEKHRAEAERRAVNEIRQELLRRLEKTKLDQVQPSPHKTAGRFPKSFPIRPSRWWAGWKGTSFYCRGTSILRPSRAGSF